MRVLIRGWKTKNLRGGLKDLEIDLGETPSRWTLIQMPNGMGKTTTMFLLRKVLTDQPIPPGVVMDLRSSDDVESGGFELRLLIDDRHFRLGVDFDFRDGSASYYTVRVGTRDGGRVPGRILPQELAELLSPELAEMFIFNGELAKQIRDMKRQTADDAIKALYRLGNVSGLKSAVDQLVAIEQQRASAITSAKEDKGVNRLRNARDDAATTKRRLENEIKITSAELSIKRAEEMRLAKLRDDRMNEDVGFRERLAKLNEEETILAQETQGLSGETLAILRRPPHVHPRLLARLRTLGGRLFELKLPETISSEFFQDLADQELCVCGRPLGHYDREYIRTESSKYLAQDQISIINQMKLALRESEADSGQFSSKIADMKLALLKRQKLKTARDRLEVERIENGDHELQLVKDQLDEVGAVIARLESQYERLTAKDPSKQRSLRVTWETNLPTCDAELKDREDKLAAATNTRRFHQMAEIMKALLDDFGAKALVKLRERVRVSTNQKLLKIAQTEILEVKKIAGGLEIASPGLQVKSDVSEGQSLSVAYAFLTSLLSATPYRLPFVVDSPAVSLDNVGRREVGQLIPDFFDQMIMFVISSERDGFADTFYGRGDAVRYLTISREDGRVKVVNGLQAFRNFQGGDNA